MCVRSLILCVAPLAAWLSLTGCSDTKSQEELALAESLVHKALQTWTEGEDAQSLTTQAPAIEFHDDDWRAGAKLVAFEMVTTYRETDGQARCAVKLNLQRGREEPVQQAVTYQVNLEPKVVIARDPFL
jgi:hypothetical protein